MKFAGQQGNIDDQDPRLRILNGDDRTIPLTMDSRLQDHWIMAFGKASIILLHHDSRFHYLLSDVLAGLYVLSFAEYLLRTPTSAPIPLMPNITVTEWLCHTT